MTVADHGSPSSRDNFMGYIPTMANGDPTIIRVLSECAFSASGSGVLGFGYAMSDTCHMPPGRRRTQVINLMEALKQSVARVQGTNSTRKEPRKTTRRLVRKI